MAGEAVSLPGSPDESPDAVSSSEAPEVGGGSEEVLEWDPESGKPGYRSRKQGQSDDNCENDLGTHTPLLYQDPCLSQVVVVQWLVVSPGAEFPQMGILKWGNRFFMGRITQSMRTPSASGPVVEFDDESRSRAVFTRHRRCPPRERAIPTSATTWPRMRSTTWGSVPAKSRWQFQKLCTRLPSGTNRLIRRG